jgi:hypothetical protein
MTAYTKTSPGAPATGFYNAGDTVTDSNDIVWYAVRTGFAGYDASQMFSGGLFVALPPNTALLNPAGAGTANGATVSAVESGIGPVHKTVLTLAATPISIADEAGQGQYGGVKIYDFPAGLIMPLGAVVDASVTLGTTGTIINTWDGSIALGVEVVADHQDAANKRGQVMPAVAVTQAVAKVAVAKAVSVATNLTESGARHLDGTSTAIDLYLNLLVTDEATHTAGTGTISGTVTFHWINLGDK